MNEALSNVSFTLRMSTLLVICKIRFVKLNIVVLNSIVNYSTYNISVANAETFHKCAVSHSNV